MNKHLIHQIYTLVQEKCPSQSELVRTYFLTPIEALDNRTPKQCISDGDEEALYNYLNSEGIPIDDGSN